MKHFVRKIVVQVWIPHSRHIVGFGMNTILKQFL